MNNLAAKILQARDERVSLIEQLIKTNKVVISLRTNYPGPNKNNHFTNTVIKNFDKLINDKLPVLKTYSLKNIEGPVKIYLIDALDGKKIKQQTLKIEDEHPLGRLIDCDVYHMDIKSISRQSIGLKPRKCYLCQTDAFICIRNGTHQLGELCEYFEHLVKLHEK